MPDLKSSRGHIGLRGNKKKKEKEMRLYYWKLVNYTAARKAAIVSYQSCQGAREV